MSDQIERSENRSRVEISELRNFRTTKTRTWEQATPEASDQTAVYDGAAHNRPYHAEPQEFVTSQVASSVVHHLHPVDMERPVDLSSSMRVSAGTIGQARCAYTAAVPPQGATSVPLRMECHSPMRFQDLRPATMGPYPSSRNMEAALLSAAPVLPESTTQIAPPEGYEGHSIPRHPRKNPDPSRYVSNLDKLEASGIPGPCLASQTYRWTQHPHCGPDIVRCSENPWVADREESASPVYTRQGPDGPSGARQPYREPTPFPTAEEVASHLKRAEPASSQTPPVTAMPIVQREPVFSGILFTGTPGDYQGSRVFTINSSSMRDWLNYLTYNGGAFNVPPFGADWTKKRTAKYLLDPLMMCGKAPVTEAEGVHYLLCHDPRVTTERVATHSHEPYMWQDPSCPATIHACLGQEGACSFKLGRVLAQVQTATNVPMH